MTAHPIHFSGIVYSYHPPYKELGSKAEFGVKLYPADDESVVKAGDVLLERYSQSCDFLQPTTLIENNADVAELSNRLKHDWRKKKLDPKFRTDLYTCLTKLSDPVYKDGFFNYLAFINEYAQYGAPTVAILVALAVNNMRKQGPQPILSESQQARNFVRRYNNAFLEAVLNGDCTADTEPPLHFFHSVNNPHARKNSHGHLKKNTEVQEHPVPPFLDPDEAHKICSY